MTETNVVAPVRIPPLDKELCPLALGGDYFGSDPWGKQSAELRAALETALEKGINHFDTASDYGDGQSERFLGEFFAGRREQVCIASKVSLDEMNANLMLNRIDQSLNRLKTDVIDIYYIHWPRKGKDLRPLMEGLERARLQGKIRAVGVSNFSVTQMKQISEVGKINVHQLGYNLFWRVAEKEIIPYCREQNIAVVTYSTIAQGILTGKFLHRLNIDPDDRRTDAVYFNESIWPYVYEGIEQLKELAKQVECPLTHLAIRWVLNQSGINTAVVGGRRPAQVEENIAALRGDIPSQIFEQMTEISDTVIQQIPDMTNMYGYYP
jgi:myo-inositol catabolism protein IolS